MGSAKHAREHELRFYPSWIAGLPYRSPDGTNRRKYTRRHLRVGDSLELRAEPGNSYDSRAVAYYHEGHHLGYVPAKHHWVSRALGEGHHVVAFVGEIDTGTWLWRSVRRVSTRIGIDDQVREVALSAANDNRGGVVRRIFKLSMGLLGLFALANIVNYRNSNPAPSESFLTPAQEHQIAATQKILRQSIDPSSVASLAPAAPPPPPPVVYENITIDKMRWSKEGAVMMATFTFKNKNAFDIKDVEVKCTLSAPSGTAVDHNTRTVYEVVKANGVKTVKDFNMGFIHSQASATSCYVMGARPA